MESKNDRLRDRGLKDSYQGPQEMWEQDWCRLSVQAYNEQ